MLPYSQYSDAEVVLLCSQGDRLAWEDLFRRYKRLIYSIPIPFGFAEEDAWDIFQDVGVAIEQGVNELKDSSKVYLLAHDDHNAKMYRSCEAKGAVRSATRSRSAI